MVKASHYLGAVLLIAGTTIGVGMLGMPVTTGLGGFYPSLLIFFVSWLVMLATAYFFLDVNFAIPGEVDFISMAGKTLGKWGKVLAWVCYLLLFYALLAAYIAASAPLFSKAFLAITGSALPTWLAPFSLPVIFGGFVYLGTFGVDLINRIFMTGLCVAYLFLVGFLPDEVNVDLLQNVNWKPVLLSFPVVIAAFGYHIIIPTLTTYMHHDRKHLRRAILIGSLIPLIIFVLWQFVILGIVPPVGEHSLYSAWKEGVSATNPLVHLVQNKWIKTATHFFSFFAIVTSFLGVSLSFSHFLRDGLKLKKNWKGKLLTILLVFVPPIIFVFTYQRGFILALEYSGAFVAILLIFLPAMMASRLKEPKFYQSPLGRTLIFVVILFAVLVVALVILQQCGFFNQFFEQYELRA